MYARIINITRFWVNEDDILSCLLDKKISPMDMIRDDNSPILSTVEEPRYGLKSIKE